MRRFFASRLFLVCVSCVAFLFAIGYARAYYQDYKVKQQINALQKDLEKLENKKLESLQILQYVMSTDFVEEKARTELNMQKPGEHVVIFPTQSGDMKRAGEAGSVSGQRIGNPLKWWYYFTHQPVRGQ